MCVHTFGNLDFQSRIVDNTAGVGGWLFSTTVLKAFSTYNLMTICFGSAVVECLTRDRGAASLSLHRHHCVVSLSKTHLS